MNADGSHPTNLTNNAAYDGEPAWSPDGSKIAFESDRDGPWQALEIYVMKLDANGLPVGAPTNITNDPWTDSGAAWSPDGSKIAFGSDRDEDDDIYVVNVDADGVPTGAPTNLTDNSAADDWNPAWSPDGSKIAFYSNRDGNSEVYVMNANGSGQTNLSKYPGAYDVDPAWSPDGSKIAFMSTRDGDADIYVVDVDANGVPTDAPTNLTNQSAQSDYSPDWQPAVGSSSQDMPVGNNVTANLDGVTLTCTQVTGAGKATLTTTKGGPAPPSQYGIVPGVQGVQLYYDISTTADCQPPIKVCITYDETKLSCAEEGIKLAKRGPSGWEYLANQTLDTVNNIICGEVDSLSLFLMMGPLPAGVGGTGEIAVGQPQSSARLAAGSGAPAPYALIAGGIAAAALALAAGGWYARRRWLR
jgi:hypothetical protein